MTSWITELGTLKGTLLTTNDAQEAAKPDLRAKTATANFVQEAAYDSASSKLDAIIGTLGKKTELGKKVARIRRGSANDYPWLILFLLWSRWI